MRDQFMDLGAVFDGFWRALESDAGWVPNRFNLYDCNFPPLNATINEDSKTLTLQFAVAGFKEENIDVNFADDKLILTMKAEELDPKEKFIRHGIRNSNSTTSYEIPFSKYDVDLSIAELKDGILKVSIPCKKEAMPKKIVVKKM